jgi:hypothetical protein
MKLYGFHNWHVGLCSYNDPKAREENMENSKANNFVVCEINKLLEHNILFKRGCASTSIMFWALYCI